LAKLKRMVDIELNHGAYLEFLNAANRDNDDWVPFDSIESLRTILFLNPDYVANWHFVMVVDQAFIADLFMKIHPFRPSVAEIEVNIAMDCRGKGLGEKLLSVALKLLNQSVDIIRIILSPGNREILPFAKASGFNVLTQVDLVHDLRLVEPMHTPSEYQIQPMGINQLEEVTVLRNQIFGTAHRVQELEIMMKEGVISTNIIIASIRSEVVGYCIAQIDNRTPHKEGSIVEISVRQEHRRKGVGKAMLLMNLDWLKSKGCIRTTVNAASNNVSALKLYEGAGFRAFRIKEKILEKTL